MSEHWHKWLSGDEWVKMGPFPDEQACPYCRTEKAEARVKGLEGALGKLIRHDEAQDLREGLPGCVELELARDLLREEEER